MTIVGDDHHSPEAHFAIAARYIHRNPLAFVPPRALPAYAHSSLGVYVDSRPAPDWLTTDLLGSMIVAEDYLDEVLAVVEGDLVPLGVMPPTVSTSVDQLARAVARVARDRGLTWMPASSR